MDELEFRRRLLADPHDNDPLVTACKQDSAANKKFADELLQFDTQLEQTIKVDVPDDLADKILFHQTGIEPIQSNTPHPWYYGLAASVAFAAGLFIGQMVQDPLPADASSHSAPVIASTTLAKEAIAHVNDEANFVEHVNENATLQQVNAKLQPLGSSLAELPGHIYYVNYCGFDGETALHLIMDSPQGKVTVFFVPTPSPAIASASDNHSASIVIPINNASLIVVGEKGHDLMPIANDITHNLYWDI